MVAFVQLNKGILTDGVDLVLNPRRHDLIPLKDLDQRPTASIVAPDPTKRVNECSRWCEKAFNGFLLERRRGFN